jgi:hypothetical protein
VLKLYRFLFFLISLLFIGCIHTQYNVNQTFPKKSVSVIPFVNFTQTPLAGYRVAGIFEGVLKSKGCHIKYSLFSFPQRDYSIDELKYLIRKIKSKYIVTGYVNEYRYKTGIDGEPAVSVTLKVYSKPLKRYIYISSFSIVGDTYSSLGVITQKGFNKILEYKPPKSNKVYSHNKVSKIKK